MDTCVLTAPPILGGSPLKKKKKTRLPEPGSSAFQIEQKADLVLLMDEIHVAPL